MTFWDHLDELRRVLFRVIGVWFVLAIGYFVAMPYLFDHVILAPCHNDFVFYDLLRFIGQKFDLTDEFFTQEFKVKLVNINLAAPFFIHMSTAFWMSVVTAMPYIFFEVLLASDNAQAISWSSETTSPPEAITVNSTPSSEKTAPLSPFTLRKSGEYSSSDSTAPE